MARKQLHWRALLLAVTTGCGGDEVAEVTEDGVYTLRVAFEEFEGLSIDEQRVLSLSNGSAADAVDLKLQIGYAYSLSGLTEGDRSMSARGQLWHEEMLQTDHAGSRR